MIESDSDVVSRFSLNWPLRISGDISLESTQGKAYEHVGCNCEGSRVFIWQAAEGQVNCYARPVKIW